MSTLRVIAYGMHEVELHAAHQALSDPIQTESYVLGEVDESDIPALEAQGLVVETLVDRAGLAGTESPAAARRSMLGATRATWEPAPADSVPEPEPGVTTQWLMALQTPLLEESRSDIEGTGVRLDECLEESSYVVSATPEQATALINLPFVVDVVRYGPAVTGPVSLAQARRAGAAAEPAEAAAPTAWDAWLVDEDTRKQLVSWCKDNDVPVVGSGGRKVRFELSGDSDLHNEIQALPGVLTVVEFIPHELHNDVSRTTMGLDGAAGGGGNPGFPYRGAGQVVGVADTGLDETHSDFQGRVSGVVARGRPGDASDPHGHGTHVAGSVLGDGSASGGQFQGAAPEANLFFQSLLDAGGRLGGLPVALSELFDEAYAAGVRIHNNSWGSEVGSAYTVESTEVDDYVHSHPDMLIVISAGNEGTGANPLNVAPGFVDWLSIGSPASCKNALSVGAQRSSRTAGGLSTKPYRAIWPGDFPTAPIADALVSGNPECLAAFSSRGPCDDRRIKPDVVAPGTDVVSARSVTGDTKHYWGLHENPAYAYMGGTSMAAPLVAGCAALVREYYVTDRGIEPSAALLKATLINGTRWLGGADSVAEFANQPNYHQGFGAIDMPRSIPTPAEPELALELVDSWKTQNLAFQRTGQRIRWQVGADPGMPLRIALAYTDLPARGLQNDLSVMVQQPDGKKRIGNEDVPQGMHIPDPDNNVELIRIEQPEAGNYIIQVFARNLLRAPQEFALVVTGKLTGGLQRMPG